MTLPAERHVKQSVSGHRFPAFIGISLGAMLLVIVSVIIVRRVYFQEKETRIDFRQFVTPVAIGPSSVLPSNPTMGQTWTNSLGMEFVFIETSVSAGAESECERKPGLPLNGYWIMASELSRSEFAAFVDDTGFLSSAELEENFAGEAWWSWSHIYTGQHPVTFITPSDAEAFAKWLSNLESNSYRLPTSVEWKWACCLNGEPAGFGHPQRYGAMGPAYSDIDLGELGLSNIVSNAREIVKLYPDSVVELGVAYQYGLAGGNSMAPDLCNCNSLITWKRRDYGGLIGVRLIIEAE